MIFSSVSVLRFCVVFLFCISLFCVFPLSCLSDETGTAKTELAQTDGKAAFVYNPVGLRDPFVALVQTIRKEVSKPKRDLGPLEKFQLSQFRLMAMLIVKGTPRAMVKAPDGKSYTVKPGDLIGPNSGVVKSIETKTVELDESTGQRIEKSPDRVVVEEMSVDSYSGKVFNVERYIEM